jgi:hypothetical protein
LVSQENFLKEYKPLRKDNVPQVKIPTDGKYPLVTPPIPPSVSIEGDMLGNISSLKIVDHDIMDEKKFPQLSREIYLFAKSVLETREIFLKTDMSATRFENSWILYLLEIPHFGRSLEINARVKLLLSFIHGGTLWLAPLISIDTELIV